MEVSGVVHRQIPCLSGVVADSSSSRRRSVSEIPGRLPRIGFQPRKSRGIACNAFVDKSQLNYYIKSTRCGAKKEMMVMEKEEEKKEKTAIKKRMKLLKGLSKNLTMFSSMGFGLDPESGLVADVQKKTISEATEILIEQLKQLKAEEKKLKKKRKEEKIKAKTMKMANTVMECESSSESSDSDCDGKVVNMSCFRRNSEPLIESLQPVMQQTAAAVAALPSTDNAVVIPGSFVSTEAAVMPQIDSSCTNLEKYSVGVKSKPMCKGVEVCMGGKCKKNGGGALLGEFERLMSGSDGSVSACKCMGKCRDGPNIRILNHDDGLNDSMRSPAKTVCLGVGLQDVEAIVSSLLGEQLGKEGLDYVTN